MFMNIKRKILITDVKHTQILEAQKMFLICYFFRTDLSSISVDFSGSLVSFPRQSW